MRITRPRIAVPALLSFMALPLVAQDRLKSMPGYDRYTLMAPKLTGAIKSGQVAVTWAEDGKSFDFVRDAKRLRFDVASKKVADAPAAATTTSRSSG